VRAELSALGSPLCVRGSEQRFRRVRRLRSRTDNEVAEPTALGEGAQATAKPAASPVAVG